MRFGLLPQSTTTGRTNSDLPREKNDRLNLGGNQGIFSAYRIEYGKAIPVDLPIPELTGANLRCENSADRWVIPSHPGDLERITTKTGQTKRQVVETALREFAKTLQCNDGW